MSFREKSAWAMGAVMFLTGLFYLGAVRNMPADAPAMAQIGPLIPYVVAVVVLSIIVQIVLAIRSPKAASAPADERERAAIDKAGNWSGAVLAIGVVSGAGNYLFWGNGNWLLFWVIGSLIIAQMAEYAFQVFLFRRGY